VILFIASDWSLSGTGSFACLGPDRLRLSLLIVVYYFSLMIMILLIKIYVLYLETEVWLLFSG